MFSGPGEGVYPQFGVALAFPFDACAWGCILNPNPATQR